MAVETEREFTVRQHYIREQRLECSGYVCCRWCVGDTIQRHSSDSWPVGGWWWETCFWVVSWFPLTACQSQSDTALQWWGSDSFSASCVCHLSKVVSWGTTCPLHLKHCAKRHCYIVSYIVKRQVAGTTVSALCCVVNFRQCASLSILCISYCILSQKMIEPNVIHIVTLRYPHIRLIWVQKVRSKGHMAQKILECLSMSIMSLYFIGTQ